MAITGAVTGHGIRTVTRVVAPSGFAKRDPATLDAVDGGVSTMLFRICVTVVILRLALPDAFLVGTVRERDR